MGTTQLRKEIQHYIENVDDRLLKAVYAMLKQYTDTNIEDAFELSNEEKAMLDHRKKLHKAGKNKSYTLAEIRKIATSKSKY